MIIYIAFLISGYLNIAHDSGLKLNATTIADLTDKLEFNKIFINNLRLLVLLFLGSITFGLSTFLNLAFNGLIFGLNLKYFLEMYRNPILVGLIVLPHGIFEIPAIIIAGAAGFKIPYEIVRYLAGKKEQILTKEDIKEYLTLALISIVLIVIAAWIEANVTLKIAKAMLKTKGI